MAGKEAVLPSPLPVLLTLTLAAGAAHAEFLHVEQAVTGLDCASCAQSVDKTLMKIKGVGSASFRLQDATAIVDLKPANRVPLDDLRDALKRIGYTPAEARVTVRGQARREGGKWLFRVAGGAAEYQLDPAGKDVEGQLGAGADGVLILEGSIAAGRGAALKVVSARRSE
jgi:copper chaperone CopZ